MKHVEAQNEHELGVFSCVIELWLAHPSKLGLRVESFEMDSRNAAAFSAIGCPVAADVVEADRGESRGYQFSKRNRQFASFHYTFCKRCPFCAMTFVLSPARMYGSDSDRRG